MSEINGTGLGSGSGKMPSELSISDFGGLTPAEYAAVLASAFSGSPSGELIDYSAIIEGDIALGNTVVMADAEWLVIDYRDDEYNHFVLRKVQGVMSRWNTTNSDVAYGASEAKKAIDSYAESLSSDILNLATPVTRGGYTSRVFMPQYSDYCGAYQSYSTSPVVTAVGSFRLCWSYTSNVSSGARIVYNASGTAQNAWMIGMTGYAYMTTSSGGLEAVSGSIYYSSSCPCNVAMQFKLRNKT